MATLSSPGVGSNLDVKTIVSQLMAVERQPLKQLDTKEASYKAKLSAFGALKSALSSLQTAAQTLNLSSTYSSVKASVADSSVLGATISGAAVAGSYNVEVKALAEAQKLISDSYAAADSPVGTGTLTFSFGKYSDAGSPPVTFAANANATKSITIDSSNNTLTGIRDAINSANIGATATIINDGNGFRLSLSSKETGVGNVMKISAAETGAAGLGQLAFDASTGGVSALTQNVAAKDAVIKVDGVTITKPGNKITDAIQGVTLDLTKQTAADTTTKLTLTRDSTTARNAIDSFVKSYNALNKQITDMTAYNNATGQGSILTGDGTVRSIQAQLRSSLSNAVAGAPAGMATLSDIGVSFQPDGALAVDSDKLDKVLADPLKDLGKLFSKSDASTGYGSRVNSLISKMIFGQDALLNGRIDGINTSLKGINTQRLSQNARLEAVERRYNAQFSALDTMISSMTTTSSFLTQQLDALSANN